ncbi:beta-glucosidase family protein [Prauserella muralis]|uniref:Glycosyl hydrolase n=1 Tax=Prauserella muralis TaxID=588067 RepID=A0A2V4BCV4_9PSEU|nr:glycoside hydrolase family 3 C-terminal domain-containing protein [Prauserella muralis]PXY31889.1 glycosyl hydrolase [Prauserella muralis]TWE13694.1 beta-glucosidase-like glycosyl hydrolase [Prauserella muralis]
MRRGVVVFGAAILAGVLAAPMPASGAEPEPSAPDCPWVGSDAPVDERFAQVLSRMTLDEKLGMVHGSAGPFEFVGPVYAGLVPAVPRLCIPQLGLSDGPAGVGNEHTGVTQLPAPLALGATWDTGLAAAYGGVIAEEVSGKGANVALTPSVDLLRDPRAGRAFETLGEDPRLVGSLAAAQIRAVQERGVLAQAKHLAAYTQETFRNTRAGNAVVSERALQELYLAPFADAVDAGVASVMCGYNHVNGVHACNNTYLVSQVLKGQLGFDGFVTSDWFATHDGPTSARAGLDMQMPGGCQFGTRLGNAVRSGRVAESRLEDMVGRILRSMFRHGLFDRPATGSPDAVVTGPEHVAIAREVAEQGTVLLRNDREVLPLTGSGPIAVIGKAAGSEVIGSGGGSPHVIAPAIVTPYDGIARRAEQAGRTVAFDDGGDAARVAREAEAAIVFVGKWYSESKDHTGIRLSTRDNSMIEEVAKANPNTVVVLNTGAGVEMPWLGRVAGVLAAWYPGQEYGNAIASLLFGDVNPSGRLPVTFPASLDQVPASDPARFPGGRHDEGLAIGYRWYDQQGTDPLFPFGFGLSYTTFRYGGLAIGPVGADGSVTVHAEVTNTGERRGAEVAQLYLGNPAADGEPPRKLAAFDKVTLDPGRSARVSFTLNARDFSHWDSGAHRWVRSAGDYAVSVGGSSRDLPLTGTVSFAETVPTGEPTPPPPPGAPAGNPGLLDTAAGAVQCPTEATFAAALGAASVTGLPRPKQAQTPPRDPSGAG